MIILACIMGAIISIALEKHFTDPERLKAKAQKRMRNWKFPVHPPLPPGTPNEGDIPTAQLYSLSAEADERTRRNGGKT